MYLSYLQTMKRSFILLLLVIALVSRVNASSASLLPISLEVRNSGHLKAREDDGNSECLSNSKWREYGGFCRVRGPDMPIQDWKLHPEPPPPEPTVTPPAPEIPSPPPRPQEPTETPTTHELPSPPPAPEIPTPTSHQDEPSTTPPAPGAPSSTSNLDLSTTVTSLPDDGVTIISNSTITYFPYHRASTTGTNPVHCAATLTGRVQFIYPINSSVITFHHGSKDSGACGRRNAGNSVDGDGSINVGLPWVDGYGYTAPPGPIGNWTDAEMESFYSHMCTRDDGINAPDPDLDHRPMPLLDAQGLAACEELEDLIYGELDKAIIEAVGGVKPGFDVVSNVFSYLLSGASSDATQDGIEHAASAAAFDIPGASTATYNTLIKLKRNAVQDDVPTVASEAAGGAPSDIANDAASSAPSIATDDAYSDIVQTGNAVSRKFSRLGRKIQQEVQSVWDKLTAKHKKISHDGSKWKGEIKDWNSFWKALHKRTSRKMISDTRNVINAVKKAGRGAVTESVAQHLLRLGVGVHPAILRAAGVYTGPRSELDAEYLKKNIADNAAAGGDAAASDGVVGITATGDGVASDNSASAGASGDSVVGNTAAGDVVVAGGDTASAGTSGDSVVGNTAAGDVVVAGGDTASAGASGDTAASDTTAVDSAALHGDAVVGAAGVDTVDDATASTGGGGGGNSIIAADDVGGSFGVGITAGGTAGGTAADAAVVSGSTAAGGAVAAGGSGSPAVGSAIGGLIALMGVSFVPFLAAEGLSLVPAATAQFDDAGQSALRLVQTATDPALWTALELGGTLEGTMAEGSAYTVEHLAEMGFEAAEVTPEAFSKVWIAGRQVTSLASRKAGTIIKDVSKAFWKSSKGTWIGDGVRRGGASLFTAAFGGLLSLFQLLRQSRQYDGDWSSIREWTEPINSDNAPWVTEYSTQEQTESGVVTGDLLIASWQYKPYERNPTTLSWKTVDDSDYKSYMSDAVTDSPDSWEMSTLTFDGSSTFEWAVRPKAMPRTIAVYSAPPPTGSYPAAKMPSPTQSPSVTGVPSAAVGYMTAGSFSVTEDQLVTAGSFSVTEDQPVIANPSSTKISSTINGILVTESLVKIFTTEISMTTSMSMATENSSVPDDLTTATPTLKWTTIRYMNSSLISSEVSAPVKDTSLLPSGLFNSGNKTIATSRGANRTAAATNSTAPASAPTTVPLSPQCNYTAITTTITTTITILTPNTTTLTITSTPPTSTPPSPGPGPALALALAARDAGPETITITANPPVTPFDSTKVTFRTTLVPQRQVAASPGRWVCSWVLDVENPEVGLGSQ